MASASALAYMGSGGFAPSGRSPLKLKKIYTVFAIPRLFLHIFISFKTVDVHNKIGPT